MCIRKNNKGISLVELLVAIAILGIAVLPLLRAFVISAQTNAKARERMRTELVATNILEGIEPLDLEELAYQCAFPSEGFTILPQSGLNPYEFTMASGALAKVVTLANYRDTHPEGIAINPNDITSSFKQLNGEDDHTFSGQASHNYYFGLKGIESAGKNYDALITVNAKTDVDNTINKVQNTANIIEINQMNADYDALCAMNQYPDDVMDEIKKKGYASLQKKDVTRKITINIESIAEGTGHYDKVIADYSYSFYSGGDRTFNYESAKSPSDYHDIIFINAGETESRKLRSIYVFFDPWYTGVSSAIANDVIEINNGSDSEIQVYLVKQDDYAKIPAEENFGLLERMYKLDVKVKNTNGGKTVINTNVKDNFADAVEVINPATYYLNGTDNSVLAEENKMTVNNTLAGGTSKDRLFDVKVGVYASGEYDNGFTGDPIVEMTGGMIN